jgi:hypothetical protein
MAPRLQAVPFLFSSDYASAAQYALGLSCSPVGLETKCSAVTS